MRSYAAEQQQLRLVLLNVLLTPVGSAYTFPKQGYIKTWREHVVKLLEERCGTHASASSLANCEQSDIYEFGVFTGRALRGLALRFNRSRVSVGNIWGFDSFEGLPRELANGTLMRWATEGAGGFEQGAFSVRSLLKKKCKDASHCRKFADDPLGHVASYIGDPRVQLVRGYYDRSLTPHLARARGMRKALYVDVDVDLYSSALTALDWLFGQGLVVPGTIIGYDDWGYGLKLTDRVSPKSKVVLQKLLLRGDPSKKASIEHVDGEPRAHREIAAKYGVRFRRAKYSGLGSELIMDGAHGPLWEGIVKNHPAAALFEVLSIEQPLA